MPVFKETLMNGNLITTEEAKKDDINELFQKLSQKSDFNSTDITKLLKRKRVLFSNY